MDFLLDNQETERHFQDLLAEIQLRRNGDVSKAMQLQGIEYKMNWGVSLIELRELAANVQSNHLLALKLWNKGWRESLILATLIDQPSDVTEEQMDFWTKSFENTEIAEQASANLWVRCKYAFVKSLEWCRGKKHLVRYTGIHLMGRLAISREMVIDEMFEPFFEEIPTLAKDKKLYTPLYRSVLVIGTRSLYLNKLVIALTENLQLSDSEIATKLGEELFEELTSEHIRDLLSGNIS